jgi:hypothetical protein
MFQQKILLETEYENKQCWCHGASLNWHLHPFQAQRVAIDLLMKFRKRY